MLLSLLVREWRSAAWSSSVEAGGTVHMVRDIIEEVASRSRHPWRCRSGRDPGATPSASAPSNERSATCPHGAKDATACVCCSSPTKAMACSAPAQISVLIASHARACPMCACPIEWARDSATPGISPNRFGRPQRGAVGCLKPASLHAIARSSAQTVEDDKRDKNVTS